MGDLRLGSMVAEVQGEGRAVVMVHGLGGSSGTFETLMDVVESCRVLRVDLPGAGRSAPRPGIASIGDLARCVSEMMRAAGMERALLVGHSMGTLVCQHMAAHEAGRVEAMLLYGALTEPPPAARTGLADRAAQALANGMAGIADAVSRASLSAVSAKNNPAARAFVRESLLRQPPEGYAAHCRMLAGARAADHARIGCAVTLVTGADDVVAPPAMARDLAGKLPQAEINIVSDCGHWPMAERPDEARAALATMLAAREAASARGRK